MTVPHGAPLQEPEKRVQLMVRQQHSPLYKNAGPKRSAAGPNVLRESSITFYKW